LRIVDTVLLVIGLLGLAAIGWWGMVQLPQAAESIETDLQIAAQDELTRAGLGWAQVSMDGQAATLRGTQPNDDIVAEAVRTVLTSSGNGGFVYGGVTTVTPVIDAPAMVSPFTWSATKNDDGLIELSGFVPSDTVRADLLARAALIGDPVTDLQALASGVPGSGWQTVAELGLTQLGVLEGSQARLRDRRLLVSGASPDPVVRARVKAELANLNPPFTGEADIRGPGRWSARHVLGTLIFSGLVNSEDEATEILAIAREHHDGPIADEMTVGADALPGWMEGVRLGLPQFTRFASGEMAFDPGGDGFRFEGGATGSTLRYLQEDMGRYEGPFRVTPSVTPVDATVTGLDGLDFTADPRGACEAAFARVLETRNIVFETGSAAVSRESGIALDEIMAVAGLCDERLVFELGGHTDDVGSRTANLRLSRERAQAIANYMIAAGFDGDRLDVVGYGPDQPIESNDMPEGQAANRRLEFKVFERSE